MQYHHLCSLLQAVIFWQKLHFSHFLSCKMINRRWCFTVQCFWLLCSYNICLFVLGPILYKGVTFQVRKSVPFIVTIVKQWNGEETIVTKTIQCCEMMRLELEYHCAEVNIIQCIIPRGSTTLSHLLKCEPLDHPIDKVPVQQRT